jgi:GT2 family glycosyltransferase
MLTGDKWALVVPNRNGARILPGLIGNVRAILPEVAFLVVDDKSTDDSRGVLSAQGIRYSVNHGARGFAATVNCGLRWVLENSRATQYVLVANSDILFPQRFADQLDRLHRKLAALGSFGALGFEEAQEPNPLGGPTHCRIERVDSASGFLFVLPVETIRRIGFLAEGYFMYGEEMDYFARAQRNGLPVYRANIGVVHRREFSGRRFLNTWLAHRNAVRFAIKSFSLARVGRTVASFVLAPMRFDGAEIAQSASLSRTLRYGALMSMAMLCAALIWNVIFLIQTVRERIAEDRYIRLLTNGQKNSLPR